MMREMGHRHKISRITNNKKFGTPNNVFLASQSMVMIKMKVFVLVLFILIGFNALGQQLHMLEGYVKYNEEALSQATVMIKKENRVIRTDSLGYFIFGDLKEGKHLLQVSFAGAIPYDQVVELRNGEKKTLQINMEMATGSMNEVVVTGTMKPIQRLNSPVAVEVYSPQYFKKNPTPSIFESLQMVNGVRPQINCSVCNTGDIHINGLEGPYTMVTIDGMPIVSSLSSVYGLFGIPNQLIERVEIIKGPASGLYGSEAIGGLINIITKDPLKAPVFAINAMSTSWWEHTLDIGLKKQWQKASSLLGVHYYNYSNKQDNNRDLFTDVTLQHRVSVFNKWNFKRNQNRTATLAGRFFYEDRWGGDMRWNPSFRGTDSIYGESIYTKRWELIGNYQLPVQEKLFFSFSATAHKQNSFYGTTPYMGDQRIGFGQLLSNKEVGARHTLLTGLAGRYNYYDDNSTATVDIQKGENQPEQYFIPGLFVQDEWEINPKHKLLTGLRVDHHPAHKFIITPRLAYKWKLSEKQDFRLNAGTGFRVVNLFTEDHAALTGARTVEIQEQLKPEQSYNINSNYTIRLGDHSKPFIIDASAWYTFFHNQIIADYDTDPQKIIYNNLRGHAISKGLSVNLEWNWLHRLKTNAGITFQDVATYEEEEGKRIKTRPILTEQFSGTWALSYSFPLSGFTIDYTGNVYSPMRLPLLSATDPRKGYSPWWTIQNIQFTKWVSGKVEIFGGVKNIFNWTPAKNNPFLIARSHDPFNKKVEYDTEGSVVPTAENPYGLTFDPSYVFAPNQGIRLFAGIKYKVK